MKSTPERASCFRTCETTSTTGPHVRLVQNFGVANATTKGRCAASSCATERRIERAVGVRRRRQRAQVAACRRERRRLRRRAHARRRPASTHGGARRGCRAPADRRALRLREHPVRPRARRMQVRDVDRRDVRRVGRPWNADRLEPGGRSPVRLLLEAARDPHLRLGFSTGRPSLRDDEEAEADRPRREVAVTRRQRDGLRTRRA